MDFLEDAPGMMFDDALNADDFNSWLDPQHLDGADEGLDLDVNPVNDGITDNFLEPSNTSIQPQLSPRMRRGGPPLTTDADSRLHASVAPSDSVPPHSINSPHPDHADTRGSNLIPATLGDMGNIGGMAPFMSNSLPTGDHSHAIGPNNSPHSAMFCQPMLNPESDLMSHATHGMNNMPPGSNEVPGSLANMIPPNKSPDPAMLQHQNIGHRTNPNINRQGQQMRRPMVGSVSNISGMGNMPNMSPNMMGLSNMNRPSPTQIHSPYPDHIGPTMSPRMNAMSPHIATMSPVMNQMSPSMNQMSPSMNQMNQSMNFMGSVNMNMSPNMSQNINQNMMSGENPNIAMHGNPSNDRNLNVTFGSAARPDANSLLNPNLSLGINSATSMAVNPSMSPRLPTSASPHMMGGTPFSMRPDDAPINPDIKSSVRNTGLQRVNGINPGPALSMKQDSEMTSKTEKPKRGTKKSASTSAVKRQPTPSNAQKIQQQQQQQQQQQLQQLQQQQQLQLQMQQQQLQRNHALQNQARPPLASPMPSQAIQNIPAGEAPPANFMGGNSPLASSDARLRRILAALTMYTQSLRLSIQATNLSEILKRVDSFSSQEQRAIIEKFEQNRKDASSNLVSLPVMRFIPQIFLRTVSEVYNQINHPPIPEQIMFGTQRVSLMILFQYVVICGGFVTASLSDRWVQIALALGANINREGTSPLDLISLYVNTLLPFEMFADRNEIIRRNLALRLGPTQQPPAILTQTNGASSQFLPAPPSGTTNPQSLDGPSGRGRPSSVTMSYATPASKTEGPDAQNNIRESITPNMGGIGVDGKSPNMRLGSVNKMPGHEGSLSEFSTSMSKINAPKDLVLDVQGINTPASRSMGQSYTNLNETAAHMSNSPELGPRISPSALGDVFAPPSTTKVNSGGAVQQNRENITNAIPKTFPSYNENGNKDPHMPQGSRMEALRNPQRQNSRTRDGAPYARNGPTDFPVSLTALPGAGEPASKFGESQDASINELGRAQSDTSQLNNLHAPRMAQSQEIGHGIKRRLDASSSSNVPAEMGSVGALSDESHAYTTSASAINTAQTGIAAAYDAHNINPQVGGNTFTSSNLNFGKKFNSTSINEPSTQQLGEARDNVLPNIESQSGKSSSLGAVEGIPKRQRLSVPEPISNTFMGFVEGDQYLLQRQHTSTYGGRDIRYLSSLGNETENWWPNVAFPLDLGTVDLHAVTCSLASRIPAEVRQALDKLAAVSANPKVHESVQHCPRLLANLCNLILSMLHQVIQPQPESDDFSALNPYAPKTCISRPVDLEDDDVELLAKIAPGTEAMRDVLRRLRDEPLASGEVRGEIEIKIDPKTGFETGEIIQRDQAVYESKPILRSTWPYANCIRNVEEDVYHVDDKDKVDANEKWDKEVPEYESDESKPYCFVDYSTRYERIEKEMYSLSTPRNEKSSFWLTTLCDRLLLATCVLRNLSFSVANRPVIAHKPEFQRLLWDWLQIAAEHPTLLDSDLRTLDIYKDFLTVLGNVGLYLRLPDIRKTLDLTLFLLSFSPVDSPYTSEGKLKLMDYDIDVHRYLPNAIDVFVKIALREDPNRKLMEEVLLGTSKDPAYNKTIQRWLKSQGRKEAYPAELLTRMFSLAVSMLPLAHFRPPSRDIETRQPYLLQGSLAAEVIVNMIPDRDVLNFDVAASWLNTMECFGARLVRTMNFMGMVVLNQADGELHRPFAKITQRCAHVIQMLFGKAKQNPEFQSTGIVPSIEHLLGGLMAAKMDKTVVKHLSTLFDENFTIEMAESS